MQPLRPAQSTPSWRVRVRVRARAKVRVSVRAKDKVRVRAWVRVTGSTNYLEADLSKVVRVAR